MIHSADVRDSVKISDNLSQFSNLWWRGAFTSFSSFVGYQGCYDSSPSGLYKDISRLLKECHCSSFLSFFTGLRCWLPRWTSCGGSIRYGNGEYSGRSFHFIINGGVWYSLPCRHVENRNSFECCILAWTTVLDFRSVLLTSWWREVTGWLADVIYVLAVLQWCRVGRSFSSSWWWLEFLVLLLNICELYWAFF